MAKEAALKGRGSKASTEREKLTFSELGSPHWMSMTGPGSAGTTAVASWALKRNVQVAVVCTHYGAEFPCWVDGDIWVVPSVMNFVT